MATTLVAAAIPSSMFWQNSPRIDVGTCHPVPQTCYLRRFSARAGVCSSDKRVSSGGGATAAHVPQKLGSAHTRAQAKDGAQQATGEDTRSDETLSVGKVVGRWFMPLTLALVMESSTVAPLEAVALPLGSQADREQVTDTRSRTLGLMQSTLLQQLKPVSHSWFLAAAELFKFQTEFPEPALKREIKKTIKIAKGETFDGKASNGNKWVSFASASGDGGNAENQMPIFKLADGAVLENVIIGIPGGDGIHCMGSCTLRNVWWEDVGEDAASFKGESANQKMIIDGGGALKAQDKVFQHNGPGTMIIRNFYASDIGKLYRSCGNCGKEIARRVEIDNVILKNVRKTVVGVNVDLGDVAKISNVKLINTDKDTPVCTKFLSAPRGREPKPIGKDADSKTCLYDESKVIRE